MYKVDNAVIMAAGTSSRFAPLSYELPKSLITVKGEVLIERQIRQLQEAGINDITIVVGYKKEKFEYLKEKFKVDLVANDEYLTRNNNGSIYVVKDRLKNTYICSSDNYFSINPFEKEVDDSYYSVMYAEGDTNEWCVNVDEEGYIDDVVVGGKDSWYMMGHTFWNEEFSKKFVEILDEIYDLPETVDLLWESIYMAHLDVLKMKMRKYNNEDIYEFDTLDELRTFDISYVDHTNSAILQSIAKRLDCREADLQKIKAFKDSNNAAAGFTFNIKDQVYRYNYSTQTEVLI